MVIKLKRVVYKKKTSKFKTFYFLIVALIIIIGASYAYFTATANNDDNQEVEVKSGCMSLELSDYDSGWSEVFDFGESKSKSFRISNTCTLDAYAKLSFLNMINTFVPGGLTYKLEESVDNGTTYELLEKGTVESTNQRKKSEITNSIRIPASESYLYKLTITYNSLNIDQTSDIQSGIFNTKFILENAEDKAIITLNKLKSLNNTITVSPSTSSFPDFRYTNSGESINYFDSDGNYMEEAEIINDSSKISNGIYGTYDDLGKTYYFRGNVNNNYVRFANLNWRIVRINGDGSIRLIYDDERIEMQQYDLMTSMLLGISPLEMVNNDTYVLNRFYSENILNNYDNYVVNTKFCLNDNIVDSSDPVESNSMREVIHYFELFDNYLLQVAGQGNKISLICGNSSYIYQVKENTSEEHNLKYPVGVLSAEEANVAGLLFNGKNYEISNNNYLVKDYAEPLSSYISETVWLNEDDSIADYTYTLMGLYNGSMLTRSDSNNFSGSSASFGIRPVLSIKGDSITSGSGTSIDPFVVA